MDQNPDVQKLLDDLKNGTESESEKAFSDIYQLFYKVMRAHAFYKLGSSIYAEDAVQEVLLSFWRRRKEATIQGSLKNYFFTAINNKAKDNQKSREHQDKYTKNETNTQPRSQDPNIKMEKDEFMKWVLEILEDSSLKTYREPFRLYFIDDLNYKEISEKLGISVLVSRTYVSRAIKIIRKKFPEFPLNLLCFIFTIDLIISQL